MLEDDRQSVLELQRAIERYKPHPMFVDAPAFSNNRVRNESVKHVKRRSSKSLPYRSGYNESSTVTAKLCRNMAK